MKNQLIALTDHAIDLHLARPRLRQRVADRAAQMGILEMLARGGRRRSQSQDEVLEPVRQIDDRPARTRITVAVRSKRDDL